jgi:hypothetical protein
MPALAAAFDPPESISISLPKGDIVSWQWPAGLDALVEPGSLWKPFIAAAASPDLRYTCDGSRCWLGRRHGDLGLEDALAESCNQWFHQCMAALAIERVNRILPMFGLPEQSGPQWDRWRCSPRRLAMAYVELLHRTSDFPRIAAGLRWAAARGTARALGPGYLAKTGTSASKRYAGDGWIVAAWPADAPRHLILQRRHGVTGAKACEHLAARLRTARSI